MFKYKILHFGGNGHRDFSFVFKNIVESDKVNFFNGSFDIF